MPNKKRIFTKDNSTKFVLMRGNDKAVNADGKTLENIFVPVSKNYKPGTSLLMSSISCIEAALCNADPMENPEEVADLGKILDTMDDSDSEDTFEHLPSKMEKLKVSENSKICDYGTVSQQFDNFVETGQFSDASDDSGSVQLEDECDDEKLMDPDCPETLKMFNAKFKKVLEEYEEDQIGPLDDEDICGYLSTSSKRVTDMLDAAENYEEEHIVLGECDEDMKKKILNYAEGSSDEEITEIVTEKPIEFDCESILSTYSNKYNHPVVIKEEKVPKIQIANNPLKKKLNKSMLRKLISEIDNSESDDVSVSTVFNARVKGETPEQRRERKNLFKEAKRESRMMKKENKLAFKKEKKIQKSQQINAQCNAGIKLV